LDVRGEQWGHTINLSRKTATPARKDITSATDETDEMDEISNYEYGVLTGASPRELKSINVCEPVTVKKYPANIGEFTMGGAGGANQEKSFFECEEWTGFTKK
jgi:hypothetical protein